MRRLDSPWLPFDAGSDHFTDLPQPEQPFAAKPLGDFAEGASPHWENAWIDLGGEG
jgi:hypothetical protein